MESCQMCTRRAGGSVNSCVCVRDGSTLLRTAGIIADRVFGYRGAVGREADPALQAVNATALGNSLLAVLGVPWLLCFIAYFRAQPLGGCPHEPAS